MCRQPLEPERNHSGNSTARYERLALSRDKDGIKQLAEKGQIIEKPADIPKDPYILEFLDLPEQHRYSEMAPLLTRLA